MIVLFPFQPDNTFPFQKLYKGDSSNFYKIATASLEPHMILSFPWKLPSSTNYIIRIFKIRQYGLSLFQEKSNFILAVEHVYKEPLLSLLT